jgi:hypothetical protein
MTEMREERRQNKRYANPALNVDIARPGFTGMIKDNPTAECVNFSLSGVQFDCVQKLKANEKLLIDIELDDIALQELVAEVISYLELEDGTWCYGARFCHESVEMKKSEVQHGLLRIEDKLKSWQEFPS